LAEALLPWILPTWFIVNGVRLMQKWLMVSALAALFAIPGSALSEPALTGKEIVKRSASNNQMGVGSGSATMVLKIKTRRGTVLERKLLTRSSTKKGLSRVRITFLEPKDQAGIELLLLERKGSRDRQYLYLPRYKTVRRIQGSAKNGRFEGSDFTYADMENREIKDGVYTRLPDETYGKKPVYRVDVKPKASADEQYSKVEMWIGKRTWIPFKIVFYNRAGRKFKMLRVRGIRKVNGKYMATTIVMKNLIQGSETSIKLKNINSNARYPESLFSPATLRK